MLLPLAVAKVTVTRAADENWPLDVKSSSMEGGSRHCSAILSLKRDSYDFKL